MCHWLKRCIEERDALVPWLKFMPCFDRLHSAPAFEHLLVEIGLGSITAS